MRHVLLLLAWLASGSAAFAQGRTTPCIPTGESLHVRDVLEKIYLWNDHLPALDPTRFPSPEAYLDAVRYRPLDERFSYIASRAANQAFFGDSQYVGLGIAWGVRGQELRVLEVFPGSPAADAGIARGDRVTAIAGRTIEDLLANGLVDAAIGAAEIGVSVSIQFVNRAGAGQTVSLTRRVVTIPTVSQVHAYQLADGRRVGYLLFRNFVQPSNAALDSAFATLASAGVSDLVLDLRYNGGGLVTVARHLASLIGGAATKGQVFVEYRHNAANTKLDETWRFEDAAGALNLSRLIVITTPASASASELLINALRPYIPVVIVGDRTYGKPVGQYQYDFCDKTLAPVSFSVRNARGEGDYFAGLPADCPAADDVDHPLGDSEEGSLREALAVAATGTCSRAVVGARSLDTRRPPASVGWQSLINAH